MARFTSGYGDGYLRCCMAQLRLQAPSSQCDAFLCGDTALGVFTRQLPTALCSSPTLLQTHHFASFHSHFFSSPLYPLHPPSFTRSSQYLTRSYPHALSHPATTFYPVSRSLSSYHTTHSPVTWWRRRPRPSTSVLYLRLTVTQFNLLTQ